MLGWAEECRSSVRCSRSCRRRGLRSRCWLDLGSVGVLSRVSITRRYGQGSGVLGIHMW
jgi:hypothetical protein